MRGPFELLADAYDYHYQYYRHFLYRRLLFSEITKDSIAEKFQYNIFVNKDFENVDQLIGKSTYLGFAAGKLNFFTDFLIRFLFLKFFF